MKNLKSMILTLAAAFVCAVSFTACSDVSVAENSLTGDDARSLVLFVREISSDLNPGYGKAVYFTGTFEEGEDWTRALRGTYRDGKWTYRLRTSKTRFEYKALIGDWDEGEAVNAEFVGFRKVGEAEILSGYQGMPSGIYYYDAKDVNYGEAIYIKHPNCKFLARAEFKEEYRHDYSPVLYNSWVYDYSGHYPYSFFNADAYVGPYDIGEKVYPEFVSLEWEPGENHICE